MQDRVSRKAKIMLEVDAGLVAAASASGLDMARLLEVALEARLRPSHSTGLTDEDRASIEDYNRLVAEHGSFADAIRKL